MARAKRTESKYPILPIGELRRQLRLVEDSVRRFPRPPTFRDVRIEGFGEFRYVASNGITTVSNFPLFLIDKAWSAGVDYEDLANGYGPGSGTFGDWSGIRDSSKEAKEAMFQRALEHFFGVKP